MGSSELRPHESSTLNYPSSKIIVLHVFFPLSTPVSTAPLRCFCTVAPSFRLSSSHSFRQYVSSTSSRSIPIWISTSTCPIPLPSISTPGPRRISVCTTRWHDDARPRTCADRPGLPRRSYLRQEKPLSIESEIQCFPWPLDLC